MLDVHSAYEKLMSAYEASTQCAISTCDFKDFIDYVIDNKHKTYKYILFTALLSKATDESINPLCLQKGSMLSGSYDARTICHKVIVPFEMEILDKALGGSNEPFLNKPARFPELSKHNAVRRGNDREILFRLCDTLPNIDTSKKAYQALVYLISKLLHVKETKENMTIVSIHSNENTPSQLMRYIEKVLEESHEGETLTLMVAGVYHLMFLHANALVEVHPVNQSGASSKEISDLDIYINDILVSSNELKDKNYAENDVRHAADKVITAGGYKLLFIEGPRSLPNENFKNKLEEEYMKKNFFLRIVPYHLFFSIAINSIETVNTKEFLHFIINTAQNNKFKDETISHILSLAMEIFGQ